MISSPSSPGATSVVPVSMSTTFASVSATGTPTLPILRLPLSGLTVATGEVSLMPKPSTILEPVSFSNFCITSSGRGAEPEKQYRTLETSCLAMSGKLLSPLKSAGTPGNRVMRCLETALTTEGRSRGFGRSTMQAPAHRPQPMQTLMPKTWNRGRAVSSTSSPYFTSGNQASICCTFTERLRWVSIAPLLGPVVPPVYWRAPTASRSISAIGIDAGALAIIPFQVTMSSVGVTLAQRLGSCFLSLSGASRLSGNLR